MGCDHPGLTAFLARHKPSKGKALLVGSKIYPGTGDRRQMYPDCVGVDMLEGDGVDIVHDMEKPIGMMFDHIDCCSVLEHVQRPWLVADNIVDALNPGGTLLLSVPFTWRVHGYPSDYWRMTANTIPLLFSRIEWAEISYYGAGGKVDRARHMNHEGSVWFERTEIFAFGKMP